MTEPGVQLLPPMSPKLRRWLNFALAVGAVIVLFLMVRRLSGVLTPIAAAMAVAYVLNPVVTKLEQFGIRRVTCVVLGLSALLVIGAVVLFGAIAEVYNFADRFPGITQAARERLDASLPWLRERFNKEQAFDLAQRHGNALLQALVAGITRWLGNAFYWLTLAVLLPMYTFVFLLNYNQIMQALRDHLPLDIRPTVLRVANMIDQAVAGFFRGRLVVALCVGLLNGLGWAIVGVPNGLVLGLALGALNLVPFLSILVLPVALVSSYIGAAHADLSWTMPVVWTMVVYLTVQSIESFVLSPLIESRANGLHPVTTVVALLIGAELLGILGMLLAIPVTSTLKMIGLEFALPVVRRLARQPAAAPFAAPAAAKPPDAGPVAHPTPRGEQP